jgi:hypothetical protein
VDKPVLLQRQLIVVLTSVIPSLITTVIQYGVAPLLLVVPTTVVILQDIHTHAGMVAHIILRLTGAR